MTTPLDFVAANHQARWLWLPRPVPPALHIVIAAGIAMAAMPALAQFDLRRVVPPESGRNIRQIERAAREAEASSQCSALKRWVSASPITASGRRLEELLPLVADANFHPHFGKTYDQLTIEDFRQYQQVLSICHRQGIFTPAEQHVVRQIWNQGTHMSLSRQLVAGRAQRSEFAGLMEKLQTLQSNDADWSELDAIGARGMALSRSASRDEQQQFQTALLGARERIGVPRMRARVERAVSLEGVQGLTALAAVQAEIASSKLSASASAPLTRSVTVRLAELAPRIAAEERARAPLRVAGREGLESSLAWVMEFDRRYRPVLALAPPMADLRQEVMTARAAAITSLSDSLSTAVRATQSDTEPDALVRRWLLDEEQKQGPGRAVRETATEQVAMLKRAGRNTAVFGPQPEQSTVVSTVTRPPSHPAVGRCDEMAAHPDDPSRAAAGVPDDKMPVKAAISACTEAIGVAPKVGRLHFQLGRALLEARRVGEAVASLSRAAELNHGGAHLYLSYAYDSGAPGLAKNSARAREHAQSAAKLGFVEGSGAPPAGQAGTAGTVLPDTAQVRARFEDARLMRAVYYGDASALPAEKLYTQAYLLAQAELLATECNSIKLTELREFRSRSLRSHIPATQSDLVRQGWESLANTLVTAATMARNPQSMVDMAAREQKVEDAPAMGQKDLVAFVQTYGACGSAPVERYTRNLRHYFSGAAM